MSLRYALTLSAAALISSTRFAAAGTTGSPGPNQLYGHITSDRTLTAASPGPNYEIIGDLTIDPGATLTIEGGITLVVTGNSDYLATGRDRSRVELTVRGVLSVAPGATNVLIESVGGDWYGLWATDGGSIQLHDTEIAFATAGMLVSLGSTATLSNCIMVGNGGLSGNVGVLVEGGGSATLQDCVIDDYPTAAHALSNGALTVSHTKITNVLSGILFEANSTGDVRGCDISGRYPNADGVGLLLPFTLSAADSLNPLPTYVAHFTFGVKCSTPGIRLDHMILYECLYGVHDDPGGHVIEYCTFVNDGWNVYGSGMNGAIYSSILVSSAGFGPAPEQMDYTDWWSDTDGEWGNVTTGAHVSSYNPFFTDNSHYQLNPASFFTNFSVSGGEIGAYGPGATVPTPVLGASVVDSEGSDGMVRIRWFADARGASKAGIFRRTEEGSWEPLTVLYPDGQGYVTLEDRDVQAGALYGYGVGVQRDGHVGIEGVVWVRVVAPISGLAIHNVAPNPATTAWSIAFDSPETSAASIEAIDLSGRVVRAVQLGALTSGRQSFSLPAQGLPPGVYWIRVREGSRSTLAKAVKTNLTN
jgi:hypothetical protein